MARIFMENENGDKVRIVERKRKGDVMMTVIAANTGGLKQCWYCNSNSSKLLISQMESKGFKVVEEIA